MYKLIYNDIYSYSLVEAKSINSIFTEFGFNFNTIISITTTIIFLNIHMI
jgi:hypothetical protein